MASKTQEIKNFDQRTFQRNVKLGLVKQEEYDAFIKALPDDAGNYDEVVFEDENAEPDFEDDDLIDENSSEAPQE